MAKTFNSSDMMRRLFERAELRILRRWNEILAELRSQNSLGALAEMISSGRITEALSTLDDAAERLAGTVQSIWVGAAEQAIERMGSALNVRMSFDVTNFRAVNMIRDSKLRMIREFTQQQRLATREALLDGISRGINPRAQARAFRDSIGLTHRQQQAVINYRKLLESGDAEALTRKLRDKRFDRSVRSAIAERRPIPKAQISGMVDRYRSRYLKYRSEVIARTESLRAVHQGTEEAYEQAIDRGVIDRDKVRRIWTIARDDRTRDSHRAMDRQEQPVAMPFISGAGNQLRYPGDTLAPPEEVIQCRCTVATRISL